MAETSQNRDDNVKFGFKRASSALEPQSSIPGKRFVCNIWFDNPA